MKKRYPGTGGWGPGTPALSFDPGGGRRRRGEPRSQEGGGARGLEAGPGAVSPAPAAAPRLLACRGPGGCNAAARRPPPWHPEPPPAAPARRAGLRRTLPLEPSFTREDTEALSLDNLFKVALLISCMDEVSGFRHVFPPASGRIAHRPSPLPHSKQQKVE
ncbi:protein transport protein SEC31-like [Rhinopithecus roxellana]|uniref:protein transport protein SEC31-like n=1 Tax=Rhinopithecus roxellana TaxID=61622 RepID=UPI0012370940|nr:protein transport protein SEC31-like [Rhinopithecus roxellana]